MNEPEPIADPQEALRQFDAALKDQEPEDEDAQVIEDRGIIRVDFGLPDGTRLQGAFAYILPLSVRDQAAIGVASAAYRGGFAPEAISQRHALLAYKAAYIQVAVRAAPPWAEDWREVKEFVVRHLYEVVAQHEATFLDGVRDSTAPGAEPGRPRGGAEAPVGGEVGSAEQG